MTTEVIMPQMGESIAEGTITRWLVGIGERVERDQPLLEISTDKVDAEIPSPATGTLLEVRFREGETVAVDTVIASIGQPSAGAAAPHAPTGGQAAPAEQVPSSQVAEATKARESVAPGSLEERLRQFSSPLVRRIAAEEGVDLSELEGSGLHGRVTRQDILQYLDGRGEKPEGPSPAPDSAPAAAEAPGRGLVPSGDRGVGESRRPGEVEFSVPAYTDNERVHIEPMTPIRRLTAAHMLYSQQTSAHVSTVFECDFSSVVAARARARRKFEEKAGTKLTFMPFVFKAVIDGLRTYPKFNASVDGTNVVYKEDVHLGMAVALDWGLLVPVIHHADRLNLVGLATQANDLAERARAKRLRPEEVRGGTFTVTNPGVFGSLFGLPMINQPQVAILCVGAIQKRPVVITDAEGNDGISIRSMAYVALSYDHRLIDGADAEQFMMRIKRTLTESSWDELSAYFE
ncbi:MAG TPA: dihydrolipoamide acetyltransferase family protein [Thermoanaerobaculia bacterium]|nr:dihydrolipoamide acetyltransferase family protein [Thermoanaerobaculia bacterium]